MQRGDQAQVPLLPTSGRESSPVCVTSRPCCLCDALDTAATRKPGPALREAHPSGVIRLQMRGHFQEMAEEGSPLHERDATVQVRRRERVKQDWKIRDLGRRDEGWGWGQASMAPRALGAGPRMGGQWHPGAEAWCSWGKSQGWQEAARKGRTGQSSGPQASLGVGKTVTGPSGTKREGARRVTRWLRSGKWHEKREPGPAGRLCKPSSGAGECPGGGRWTWLAGARGCGRGDGQGDSENQRFHGEGGGQEWTPGNTLSVREASAGLRGTEKGLCNVFCYCLRFPEDRSMFSGGANRKEPGAERETSAGGRELQEGGGPPGLGAGGGLCAAPCEGGPWGRPRVGISWVTRKPCPTTVPKSVFSSPMDTGEKREPYTHQVNKRRPWTWPRHRAASPGRPGWGVLVSELRQRQARSRRGSELGWPRRAGCSPLP